MMILAPCFANVNSKLYELFKDGLDRNKRMICSVSAAICCSQEWAWQGPTQSFLKDCRPCKVNYATNLCNFCGIIITSSHLVEASNTSSCYPTCSSLHSHQGDSFYSCVQCVACLICGVSSMKSSDCKSHASSLHSLPNPTHMFHCSCTCQDLARMRSTILGQNSRAAAQEAQEVSFDESKICRPSFPIFSWRYLSAW